MSHLFFTAECLWIIRSRWRRKGDEMVCYECVLIMPYPRVVTHVSLKSFSSRIDVVRDNLGNQPVAAIN